MTTNTSTLIQKAIAGDQNALLEVLLEVNPKLSQFVRFKLAATPSLSRYEDDILQETYIQAFNQIGSLRISSNGGLIAWLKAVAMNQIREITRRMATAKRGGDRVRVGLETHSERALGLIQELSDPGVGTPSQFVARNEAVTAMRIAMSQLPPDQRLAVSLHCLQGRSLEETAEQMQRTSGSIRGLIQRAKQSLRNSMLTSSLWLSKKG